MRTAPTPNDMSEVVRMRRREKIHSGSTGSAARRSMSTNATRSTAATEKALPPRVPRPGLAALEHGEDQQQRPTRWAGAPATSMRCFWRCTVSW